MAESLHLRDAVAALRRGGVIAYPTEAVWGLGCEPTHRAAVEHILSLKKREWRKGLILIAARPDQLAPFVAWLPPQRSPDPPGHRCIHGIFNCPKCTMEHAA